MSVITEFPPVPSSPSSTFPAKGPAGILADWFLELANTALNSRSYRLACPDDVGGYKTSSHGYLSGDAALRAAPVLNSVRAVRGEHPYTHLAEYDRGRCLKLSQLELS